MNKISKIVAITLACMIMMCMAVPAFATTGFEEGPTGWLQGNGTSTIGNNIVATATGNSLYVGGRASFKTTGSVAKRTITVTVGLYDVDTDYCLGYASKSQSVSCTGAMAPTGYYSFKGTSTISYYAGQECRYKVTRSNFNNAIYGRYKGYLSD